MYNTIFVSIASYRDPVCVNTINSIYNNANNPDNIFLGICQQNNSILDEDCINNKNLNINENLKKNIRIIRIPYYDAKGPVYARYLCSSLMNNETFYMQIDSHTTFIKNWDVKCINMINEIKSLNLSKKPVISYYPKDITKINDINDNDNNETVPVIYEAEKTKKNIITFKAAIYTNTKGNYIKTPFATAGMIFCESYFLNEMPFDPTLDYLFTGEEILNSIKFYTNGWDIFSPKENIIFHEYLRNDKPKYWNDKQIKFNDKKAIKKIKYYLYDYHEYNRDPYYSNYKLGTVRTLESYFKYAKIDIDKNENNNYKKHKIYLFSFLFIILFIAFILFPFQFYF